MTQGSQIFVTSNCQQSLRHILSIYHNDRTFRNLAANPILAKAVKDNKEISFEREASIAEIHAQSVSPLCKNRRDSRDIKSSISNTRIAGNATIAGKLNQAVSISMQRSLVTNLCYPCVTSDPLRSYGNKAVFLTKIKGNVQCLTGLLLNRTKKTIMRSIVPLAMHC